ncbi:hypothetical protein EF294_03540 [Gordonia oryzae]|uniref:Uncharacterized protein n=1 Tax=Gordonia oryzae TaxID=2487349 RepID=A0A3N4GSN0_9ACTN|nr:hypothetical protein [Gordonia oryzae]RPA65822.1 hypothetical protein EF294_03540 [Gordonia oryzae]
MTTESAAAEWLAQQRRRTDATEHVARLLANNAQLRPLKGIPMSDPVANASQLGDAQSTWGKTPRQLAAQYNADQSDWGRVSIERAALLAGNTQLSWSPYANGNTTKFDVEALIRATDARSDAMYVEAGAAFGDPDSISRLTAAAAAGNARAIACCKHLGLTYGSAS